MHKDINGRKEKEREGSVPRHCKDLQQEGITN
jgi:hypothetical protein